MSNIIGMPETSPFSIIKIIRGAIKALKSIFAPPKKNEKPEDVAERNLAFQMFCERVNIEARQVESYVRQQLDDYGEYLSILSRSDEYDLLKRNRVNMRGMLNQLALMKNQIPGIIGTEVSRRLSDTDSECLRIRRMLSGAEKNAQMEAFLRTIIAEALEKCASTTESIMNQMQDIFTEDLQDCLDTSQRQLEKIENGLAGLGSATDEVRERVRMRAEAEQIIRCSGLISELFQQEG